MQDFARIFDGVEDPRTSNATRHDLHEMPMIALLCMICGGQTCTDMELFGRSKEAFLRRFMKLAHGIPSHDAFSSLFRVLVRLASDWVGRLGPEVIAIDGKALRRSFEDASRRSPLHVVNAFAAGARLTLGQVRVDGKSNEMPALLELLDVKGMTVTADAMHTQRDTAKRVTEAGGNYVLALKGNQETLHDDVRLHMADPGGGRLPRRRHAAGPALPARPASRREGHRNARDQGGAEHGDPLLPAQRNAWSGAVPEDRALALGGGKLAPLGPGRDHGGRTAFATGRTTVPRTWR